MKRLILLLFCIAWHTLAKAEGNQAVITSLLKELDLAIERRPIYMELREQELAGLRKRIAQTRDNEERFDLLGSLLEKERSFNTDSALSISQERERLAIACQRQEWIDNARMNTAELMGIIGMYKEAIDLMQDIPFQRLPDYLHAYYYHICRTNYGLMADYAVTEQEKTLYADLTDRYRDSLLLANPKDLLVQTIIRADQHNVHGEYDQSIRMLTDYLASEDNDLHNIAICAYTLSEAYRQKGDHAREKEYLITSAIADMKTAVREYVSLRKLAVLLYREGDIERAYSYLTICMEDANACNARLRKLEILEIFPIVNDAYRLKEETRQKAMKWSLFFISLLSIFLLLSIFYVWKQMKRVAAARREVVNANRHLKGLNEELQQKNEQLKEANRSIAENSHLKEEYIGHYMDQCSAYLEKMDNYRRSLGKLAAAGNVDELYKTIKSGKVIEGELKEFYASFDNNFLQLFPTFVEEFNALLAEGEQIHPKQGERMNTELRIFALIRLGITDSVKIAQFLRYSVTTIYNYRTKVRNKAAGERDKLEQEVMQIGKV